MRMNTAPTRRELRKNLKELRAILEERPMDLDARMRVARTFRLMNDTNEAINHYQQVARYLSLAGKPIMAIHCFSRSGYSSFDRRRYTHFLRV